jgi:hypothetical protein
MVEVEIVQLSLLVDVRVSIIVPAALSAAVVIYCAFKALLDGENVPVPEVVQMPVEVPPVTVPLRNTNGLAMQTTWSGPAFAKGGSSTATGVTTGSVEHPLTVTTS